MVFFCGIFRVLRLTAGGGPAVFVILPQGSVSHALQRRFLWYNSVTIRMTFDSFMRRKLIK